METYYKTKKAIVHLWMMLVSSKYRAKHKRLKEAMELDPFIYEE